MEAELDNWVKALIAIIVVCTVGMVTFYFLSPKVVLPVYNHVTFNSEVKHYTLNIKSGDYSESITITNNSYDMIMKSGVYKIEACFFSITGDYECESREVTIDSDTTVQIFADWGN